VQADGLTLQEQQSAARAEALRAEALLQGLRSGRVVTPGGLPAAQASLLAAEWADVQGRTARLDAEIMRRQAELATVREALEKLRATLPLARQREADITALAAEGMVPAHAAQDRTRERIEAERDLATWQARQAEAEAALAESRQARAAEAAALERGLNERLARARAELAQLRPQGRKTERRESLTRLTAPVAGIVQQRAIHTPGGVVTPAQPLMVIVPEDGAVIAEVAVANQDIGFVHEGQPVEVKLETFSFTRYGTVPATVQHVSADAVVDDKRGALFTATLAFDRDRIMIDGRPVRLAAGMNVTAEIKTGKRRVIEFLWSPVQKTVHESLRER
jgi:hemolysin D